jgi:hypothetical protein
MRDARTPVHFPPPADWGDAFAALPMEAPSAPGWARVAAALDARGRSRWPLWLATAAALALVALVPLQRSRQEDKKVDARPLAAASEPVRKSRPAAIDATPAATAPSGNRPLPPGHPADSAVASRLPTSPSIDAPAATVAAFPRVRGNAHSRKPGPITTASTTREHAMAARLPPRTRARADAGATDAASTLPAVAADDGSAAPGQSVGPVDAGTTASATPESLSPELDRLHAESAQLEALVALARDGRMSTGAVAALGAELQAQVARIDAALAEPSPTPEQRLGLWRDRVAALRELAGFETTQRLLAARGEQYDGMLVSVD